MISKLISMWKAKSSSEKVMFWAGTAIAAYAFYQAFQNMAHK